MELNSVLRKVRALVATAEHPNTPEAEAATARAMADKLMLDYAIQEAQLEASRPAPARTKPAVLDFPTASDSDLTSRVSLVMLAVARHCRCRVREYVKYDREQRCWMSRVYGYEHDLRYFEVLYTTLRLHMLGALRPEIDPSETPEENAYRMHQAGYNWLEIAGKYGWKKLAYHAAQNAYSNGHISDETYARWLENKCEIWHNENEPPLTRYKTNWQVGSYYKRLCQKATKAKGEGHHQVIAAGGTETYRRSAARGYASRITQRLHKIETGRTGIGTELDLRKNDLEEFFKEENPDLFKKYEPPPPCEACSRAKSGHCRAHPKGRAYTPPPFSDAGYQAGVNHADTADLAAGDRLSTTKRELG